MSAKYDTRAMEKDFTPTGIKVEGRWENDRNSAYAELYKAIIREVYEVKDVICAHHLTYVCEEERSDGFNYQVVQEIPSADALIFDHKVARRLWGEEFLDYLALLAREPVETRDALLSRLYYARG